MTQTTRFSRGPDLLARTPPGLVVLALVDGTNISLTGTGESVWRLLDRELTIGELAAELASIYDAEPSRIATDIQPVLTELVESGFLVTDA